MEDNVNVMKVVLKNSFGECITVNIYPEDTIKDLKTRIRDQVGIPLEFSQLNNNGQKITDDQKVVDYISNGWNPGLELDGDKVDASFLTSTFTCIVPDCRNSKTTCPDRTFFALPSTKEKRQRWLIVCKREDLADDMTPSLAVCSDHFIQEQFTNSSRRKLKEDSVPTVFPMVQSSCDQDCVLETEDSVFLDICETIIKTEPDAESSVDAYMNVDDGEITKHPGQLCRLCASNTGDVIYIFSSTGKQLNIANKINESLPVLVQKTDPLPKQLCSACVVKLDMCYAFSQSCLEAEEKLKSLTKLKRFWSCPSDEAISASLLDKRWCKNPVLKSEPGLLMKCENFKITGSRNEESTKSCNSSSDTINNKLKERNFNRQNKNSYCCPLCCEGEMIVCRKDSETSTFTSDLCSKTENSSLEDKQICEPSVECNNNCNKDNDVSVKTDTGSMDHMQHNIVYEVRDVDNNYTLVESSVGWWNDENTLESAEIIIETLNPEDAKVLCEMNDDSSWNLVSQLDLESSKPTCQLCGESFISEELCLDHSRTHSEEDCYPCSLCGMIFTNELDITSHCEEHKAEGRKTRTKISKGRLTCSICGRRFNNEKTLSEHTCGTNEAKQFRCETCKKSYISEVRLRFHRQFHEGAKPNHCSQCGKEFDNEGSLYYHTRMVHEGARPFCCEECGKRFYSNARLEAHKRVHSGERPFECEVCGRRFYDRETLKGHYITHMSVKPFQCDLCGVCCGRKSLLKQHIHIHHSNTYMPKRIPSLIHYFCKICNETFTSSSDVLTHRTTHWGMMQNGGSENKEPKPHVCEYCGEAFSMVNTLGRHRKQEHPNEQPYVCSICKETSRTLYEARAHRKIHTSAEDVDNKEKAKPDPHKVLTQKVFICEECGKPLPGRRKFMAHMKAHRMDLPFECTVCGKKFTEKQRLLVHMRLHTGEKPYSCSECGKRFTQSSALYTHALLHTGEKPHSCDLCGKAFRIKADRDNHRRTHTGEKPYHCEFCQKQFRTGQVYYQHRMIHTGERRFPCDICGKAFKRSHTLVVHKRIHTGEKPNICDICGRGFRQRTDMKKHRALHAA
ncbi:zinc finger protein 624-like isoform X2 [Periplaneta americana]|uniref:zinc finger protein 624-like isoform X2 n=1 Tax=Periplaneta americana TaxID=6978 RepID=UPI0037E8BB11